MRLFLTTLVTLIVLLLAGIAIRLHGYNRQDFVFPTDFYKTLQKPYLVTDWQNASRLKGGKHEGHMLFWIDVVKDEKGFWAMSSVNPVIRKPLLEAINSFPPEARLMLNIKTNAEYAHQDLAQLLAPYENQDRIAIQSDYNTILISMKELSGRFLYGTGTADITRALIFASMHLETVIPFKGDIWLTPLKLKNVSVTNETVISEMKRRNKTVIIGPLNGEKDFKEAQELNPDGFLIHDITLL